MVRADAAALKHSLETEEAIPLHERSLLDLVGRFSSLSQYVRWLVALYVITSVIYTAAHIYVLFASRSQVAGFNQAHDVVSGSSSSFWPSFASTVAPLQHISDDLLYSKLFQTALKPTSLKPFYLKASHAPIAEDITITTLITVERLSILDNLVRAFQGPISVAVHVNDDVEQEDVLEKIRRFQKASPPFAKYVDVHVIIDNYDRQFNYWRNVARFFARTNLIMAIDVDFMLCSDLKKNYNALSSDLKMRVQNGSIVFVVPAFEYSKKASEVDVATYPTTKSEVVSLAVNNDLVMFHNKWKRGHGPTNYLKWYKATEPYQVVEYNYNYEPYVLMNKNSLPWCDERFVGYGSNKAACLYEIFLAGADFWVLPNDFLIHQRHPYPENDRRIERKYNKRLYDAYREEACFRYSQIKKGVRNASAIDDRICGAMFPNFYGL